MAPRTSLPFELTEKIILLATEDLVDQERQQPTPTASPVNAFLALASLVSSTWRTIVAQLALTRHGLVTPRKVERFLEQMEESGLSSSLASVRSGPGGRLAVDGESGDGGALVDLVDGLPALEMLECVGGGLVCKSPARQVSRYVPHIVLVKQTVTRADSILAHFTLHPPSNLSVNGLDNPEETPEKTSQAAIRIASSIFPSLAHFKVESTQLMWILLVGLLKMYPWAANLETCHLEFSSCQAIDHARREFEWSPDLDPLPVITHLATHLRVLSNNPNSQLPLPTSLVSIRILPNPPPQGTNPLDLDVTLEDEAEEALLSVLRQVQSLTTLAVPSRWTFESVEHECEARGIKLSCTGD